MQLPTSVELSALMGVVEFLFVIADISAASAFYVSFQVLTLIDGLVSPEIMLLGIRLKPGKVRGVFHCFDLVLAGQLEVFDLPALHPDLGSDKPLSRRVEFDVSLQDRPLAGLPKSNARAFNVLRKQTG